jgi:hypothetical protein
MRNLGLDAVEMHKKTAMNDPESEDSVLAMVSCREVRRV